jgi:TetR/AcrR family transcriptional regulator, regulator of cefoperazone and chloramphenicol sensitivity
LVGSILRQVAHGRCSKLQQLEKKSSKYSLTNLKLAFNTHVSNGCLTFTMAKTTPVVETETRSRLLRAAAHLFGERGFNHVSVREICKEAGTNVAAVNYHFRDKLGLYRELIGTVAEGMHRGKIAALDAGAGQPPEEQLRAYIHGFLHQLLDSDPKEECWMDKLIAREMMEPTAALDLIIEKGIKPSGERLNRLVGDVLGLPPGDERVLLCAGTIQGLCLWHRTSRSVAERLVPDLRYTPDVIDGIAEFVSNFALAGMRAALIGQNEHEGAPASPVPR